MHLFTWSSLLQYNLIFIIKLMINLLYTCNGYNYCIVTILCKKCVEIVTNMTVFSCPCGTAAWG